MSFASLKVTVHQADGLIAKDADHEGRLVTSDPVVELTYGNKSETTTIQFETLSPAWTDAVFHFPWRPGDKHTTLTLTIWDDDEDEKDERDFLGKVELTGKQLIAMETDRASPPQWHKLQKRSHAITSLTARGDRGRLQLSLVWSEDAAPPNPKPPSALEQRRAHTAKKNPTVAQSAVAAAAAAVSSASAPALPSGRSAHGLVEPASTATGGSSWREGDLVFHPEHLKGTLVEIEHGNARGKPYRVVFNGSLDEHWYNAASMDKLSKIGHDDAFRAPAAASTAAADEPKELAPIASLGGKAGPLRRPSQKPADASGRRRSAIEVITGGLLGGGGGGGGEEEPLETDWTGHSRLAAHLRRTLP